GEPVEEARHAVGLGGVVDGTVEDALLVRPADRESLGRTGERGDQVVVERRLHQHAGDGGAVLPGVEEGGLGDVPGGRVRIHVAEDDRGGLAAQLQVDILQVGRGRGHDLGSGAGGTGEGDHLHVRVLDQRPAGVAVTAHDV